jgi:hypothetical protein
MAMLNPTSGKAVSETMAFFIMPSSDGIWQVPYNILLMPTLRDIYIYRFMYVYCID